MITLEGNELVIRFPEVHRDAVTRISFQRTLRIPDDGRDYPLPPGLGTFPLHHVEDHLGRLPAHWAKHGGVFLPMYQSEALWINFGAGFGEYPIALQIAAGKINAINGEPWHDELQFEPQGYVVTSQQPWLDGFCVEKGRIRQFVAAPLGKGITVEEQVTNGAEFGGIQIKAWPLKAEVYERLLSERPMFHRFEAEFAPMSLCSESMDMGLGMGGSMRQEVYEDVFEADEWNRETSSRCFIHLLNSIGYAQVTGHLPPHRPFEAADYAAANLPWFEYYSDRKAIEGNQKLQGLKTWKDFPDGHSDQSVVISPKSVVPLGDKAGGRPVSQGQTV